MKLILRRYRVVWTRKALSADMPVSDDGIHRTPSNVTFSEPANALQWAREAVAEEHLLLVKGRVSSAHTEFEVVPEDHVYYADLPRAETEDGSVRHLVPVGLFDPDGFAPVGVALDNPTNVLDMLFEPEAKP